MTNKVRDKAKTIRDKAKAIRDKQGQSKIRAGQAMAGIMKKTSKSGTSMVKTGM